MLWEPVHLLRFELLVDVRLDSVEVRLILRFQVNDEVDVVPQKVIFLGVIVVAFFSVTIELIKLLKEKTKLTVYLSKPHMKQMFLMSSSRVAASSLS